MFAALEQVVAGAQFEWGAFVALLVKYSESGDVDKNAVSCTSLNHELSFNTSGLKYIHGIRMQLF